LTNSQEEQDHEGLLKANLKYVRTVLDDIVKRLGVPEKEMVPPLLTRAALSGLKVNMSCMQDWVDTLVEQRNEARSKSLKRTLELGKLKAEHTRLESDHSKLKKQLGQVEMSLKGERYAACATGVLGLAQSMRGRARYAEALLDKVRCEQQRPRNNRRTLGQLMKAHRRELEPLREQAHSAERV